MFLKKGEIKELFFIIIWFLFFLPLFFPLKGNTGYWDARESSKFGAVNSFQQSNNNSEADGTDINRELEEWQCPSLSLDQAEIFPWTAFSNNKNILHFCGPSIRDLPRVFEFPYLPLWFSLGICRWRRNEVTNFRMRWSNFRMRGVNSSNLCLFNVPPLLKAFIYL